jgi:hypothetical protein
MASIPARVKRLEEKAVRLESDLKKQKELQKEVEAWIKAQVRWSKEVTKMLRLVNWAKLAKAYPGGGGTNPPQTPPDWPMT